MLGTFGGVDGPLLLFPGLGKKSSIGVGQSCLLPTTLPVSTRDREQDKGALCRMGGNALPSPTEDCLASNPEGCARLHQGALSRGGSALGNSTL